MTIGTVLTLHSPLTASPAGGWSPTTPYLTKKYNTHINVEFCASVKAVKYLFKYVLKGHDEATLSVRTRETLNEIKEYIHGRYVCAIEAAWQAAVSPMSSGR